METMLRATGVSAYDGRRFNSAQVWFDLTKQCVIAIGIERTQLCYRLLG